MKKLLLAVVLMLGVATVSAQEVGSVWVGGTAGVSSKKVDGSDRVTSYKFIPEVGYVLSENLGLGIKLGYGNEGKAGWDAVAQKAVDVKTVTVNPFVRYTFVKGNIGGLFVDGGVGYSNIDNGQEKKMNRFDIGVRPGVFVNVTDKVSILGNFGFLGYKNAKQGDAKSNEFELDLDMTQFTFGVNVFF